MIDSVTGKPIKIVVHNEEIAFIDLPASQMDAVSQLFAAHDIPTGRITWSSR